MNIWENTVLTDQGRALQAKLLKGQTLKITRVTTGTKKVPVVDLRQQTAVTEGGYDLTIQPARTEEDKTVIPVLLENKGLGEGYELWQVGFYAEDPDEGEILFCLSQASQARNIPAEAESPGFSITWDFYFNTSDTAPFEVVLDSAGLVSVEQYQVHSDEINKVNGRVDSLNSALSSTTSALTNRFECGSLVIKGKSGEWSFVSVTFAHHHKTPPVVVASHASANVAQCACTIQNRTVTGFVIGVYNTTVQTAFNWIAIELN